MTDLVTVLDQCARVQPNQEALRAQGRAWSYAQLADASRRAAAVLQAQGVGQGDRVAMLCLNTPGFVFTLFGAWRLGAVAVPINHKLQAPEIAYVLQHSQVALCVFDGALAETVQRIDAPATRWLATDSAAAGVTLLDDLLESAAPFEGPAMLEQDSLAEILYTSGTTGRTKGCLHSHRNVFQSALSAVAATSITLNR